MLSLHHYFDQALGLQAIQMDTRGRWAHVRDDGEFRAGARVIIQQAIEHARPRRLADRRRDARRRAVRVRFIHSLMLDEVSMACKLYL